MFEKAMRIAQHIPIISRSLYQHIRTHTITYACCHEIILFDLIVQKFPVFQLIFNNACCASCVCVPFRQSFRNHNKWGVKWHRLGPHFALHFPLSVHSPWSGLIIFKGMPCTASICRSLRFLFLLFMFNLLTFHICTTHTAGSMVCVCVCLRSPIYITRVLNSSANLPLFTFIASISNLFSKTHISKIFKYLIFMV